MATFQYGGLIERITTITAAAGTTTLTNFSPQIEILTGSTTQIFQLPDATTFSLPTAPSGNPGGAKFEFYNTSTGILTINNNGGTTLFTVKPSASIIVKLESNTTTNGVWVALASTIINAFTDATSYSGTNQTLTSGDQNYNFVRLTTVASGTTFSGIPTGTNGQTITISNQSSNLATIVNNHSPTGPTNILTGTGANVTMPVGSTFIFTYDTAADSGNGAWLLTGGSGSSGGLNPWAASFPYVIGNCVTYNKDVWIALTSSFTSSSVSFEADYQAGNWQLLNLPVLGRNYLAIGNTFEDDNVSGWTLAHSSLSSTNLPTSVGTGNAAFSASNGGSGANANTHAPAVVSSGQLSGQYSMSFSASGATNAGDMYISPAVAINICDQSKTLQFSFAYSAVTSTGTNFSGTSSNTFGVAIYDLQNNAWIIPVGVFNFTQISGVGYCTGSFQTPANMGSFQIAVYNPTAGPAGGFALYLDDFYVGPGTSAAASASQAPTVQVLTSGTTYTAPSNPSPSYLRVTVVGGGGGGGGSGTTSTVGGSGGGTSTFSGGTVSLSATGGSAAGTNDGGAGGAGTGGYLNLSGQVGGAKQVITSGSVPVLSGGIGGSSPLYAGGGLNSSAVTGHGLNATANSGGGGSGALANVAGFAAGAGGGGGGMTVAIVSNPLPTYTMAIGSGGTNGSGGAGSGYVGGTGAAGIIIVEEFYGAGTGGSSGGGSGSGAIAAKATTSNTSIATTATTNVIFSASVYDTNAGYSTSTGKYTVPITGYWKVTGIVTTQNTGTMTVSQQIKLTANQSGSVSTTSTLGEFSAQTTSAVGAFPNGSTTFYAQAGDLLWLTVTNGTGNTITLDNTSTNNYVTFELISGGGSSSSSSSGSNTVAMKYNTTSSSVSAGIIILTNKIEDTTNSYNTSTGVWTCPQSGTYHADGTLISSATAFAVNGNYEGYASVNAGGATPTTNLLGGSRAETTQAVNRYAQGGTILKLNAGDTVSLFQNSSVTIAPVAATISIYRIGN